VVVFLDLRGFTAFTDSSEPEEVMGVLGEYHRAMGQLILAHEGTLERFAGDGMMVFFNDPIRRAAVRRGERRANPHQSETLARIEDAAQAEPLGAVTLKGLAHPVPVFNVTAFKA
jgi:class 3 adenylate cyclase